MNINGSTLTLLRELMMSDTLKVLVYSRVLYSTGTWYSEYLVPGTWNKPFVLYDACADADADAIPLEIDWQMGRIHANGF
jgi:hypothetical protein